MTYSDLVADDQLTPPVSDVNVAGDEVSVLDTKPFQDLPWYGGEC